jgi:predicted nucleotidyltransferase
MPKRIYLFGSFAKDAYDEDNDYDFYVVVPDDAGNKIELSQKAYKSLCGVRKRPVDIAVGYESSFDERAKENTLEKVVKQEGVLLYEK